MLEKDKQEQLSARLSEVTYGETNYLVGKISTLLDAMLSDERQAKAAKDIARNLIWERKNGMDKEFRRILIEQGDEAS